MQARTLLVILSVLQLIAIGLNFSIGWTVAMTTFPICLAAVVALWMAIWCQWRNGILVFLILCTLLLGYSFAKLVGLIHRKETGSKVLDMVWYSLQLLFELLCILAAVWVLREEDEEQRKEVQKATEKKPLFGWGGKKDDE